MKARHRLAALMAAGIALCVASPLAAQVGAGPKPVVRSAPLPLLEDRRFEGTITLAVDATDTRFGIISARETIPVQAPGDMILLYPEWETASHAPTVPVASLAGLVVYIDGRRVEWRRDSAEVHAFHVPVPAGAKAVSVDLHYIADRGSMHAGMLTLPWQRTLLYPAGWFARDLPVSASLRLPDGAVAVTSLDRVGADPAILRFATTSLERLVDAPVFAAPAMRSIVLTPGGSQPVRLRLLAGDEAGLSIADRSVAQLRELVAQTSLVFGLAPFRHYDMVVLLDDGAGPGGTEHLETGENDLPASFFRAPEKELNNQDLIAHEFVHAWNGRFRQPADLWTPTFNQPVSGSLLWVYEGQTEFWGRVLAARAGLRSLPDTLDRLALDAALVANRPGRAWKSLADSTNDAIYMAGHRVGWRNWQRREDYYPEGVMLWLDVDARLRELSGGTRGLDDFAAYFFRALHTDGVISTYTFEDVCSALDKVAHDDWAVFLRQHLDTHDDAVAMAGLARAGWRLTYTAEPTEAFRQEEAEAGGLDLTYSIGAVVAGNGRVASVAWNGPAFRAGLVPGARIVSVAGTAFSIEGLRAAVAATPRNVLLLQVSDDAGARTISLSYDGGLRYPRLERIAGQPDRLTRLLNARTGSAKG